MVGRLVQCGSCSKLIDRETVACPSCGRPNAGKDGGEIHWCPRCGGDGVDEESFYVSDGPDEVRQCICSLCNGARYLTHKPVCGLCRGDKEVEHLEGFFRREWVVIKCPCCYGTGDYARWYDSYTYGPKYRRIAGR
jgi:hypothetical protein